MKTRLTYTISENHLEKRVRIFFLVFSIRYVELYIFYCTYMYFVLICVRKKEVINAVFLFIGKVNV